MKPVRTAHSNEVFILPGGTRENDLPVEITTDEGDKPCIRSVWEPTIEERREITDGANISLVVWGIAQPPVAVNTIGGHTLRVHHG